jgi:hypothetical protein
VEDPSFGTHYVVLVRELRLPRRPTELPTDQHARYRWMSDEEILRASDVHPLVKRYLEA